MIWLHSLGRVCSGGIHAHSTAQHSTALDPCTQHSAVHAINPECGMGVTALRYFEARDAIERVMSNLFRSREAKSQSKN